MRSDVRQRSMPRRPNPDGVAAPRLPPAALRSAAMNDDYYKRQYQELREAVRGSTGGESSDAGEDRASAVPEPADPPMPRRLAGRTASARTWAVRVGTAVLISVLDGLARKLLHL